MRPRLSPIRKTRILSFLLPFFLLSAARASDEIQKAKAATHYQQGLAYERLGRVEESYTQLQLAAALEPNNPQMALALGVVANRLGRHDEAQRALERSIALDAHSTASYYELAMIYEKKGMTERAIENWQRFLQLNHDAHLRAIAEKHIHYLQASQQHP